MASLRKHKGNVWFKIRHYNRTFTPQGHRWTGEKMVMRGVIVEKTPSQIEFRQGLDAASVGRGFLFGRDKHNCVVVIQPATEVEIVTHLCPS